MCIRDRVRNGQSRSGFFRSCVGSVSYTHLIQSADCSTVLWQNDSLRQPVLLGYIRKGSLVCKTQNILLKRDLKPTSKAIILIFYIFITYSSSILWIFVQSILLRNGEKVLRNTERCLLYTSLCGCILTTQADPGL